jgi:hypothetical protein
MKANSKTEAVRSMEAVNAHAAWIILQDRERYPGLPVEWAELWVERHGPARKPVEQAGRTIEDRLAAHEEKQRKKKIARRRERWSQREWRRSRKRNAFTNVDGFRLVVFARNGEWQIGVSDRARMADGMIFMPQRYATEEAALAGAFDVLLYMQSKRSISNLEFIETLKTA